MDQRSGHAQEAERFGAGCAGSAVRARSTAAGGASHRVGSGAGSRPVATQRGSVLGRAVAPRRSDHIVSMGLLERNPGAGAAGAARKRWTPKRS
ncbi:uncharacterized protein SOCE836_017990 [Sorangium cellulosum]|uniref:Uncharacterized protein n=1 Tax=Sorangium cellulosum TaxID=56 RepID=A0A4P2QJ57_SORCE|nr:uncharacterized protein SOCE836_017990 [Sorangium cellulosum]WCQ89097.1 hypothetical protein NQZ70_01783 [Sorangium sp. Soce836]